VLPFADGALSLTARERSGKISARLIIKRFVLRLLKSVTLIFAFLLGLAWLQQGFAAPLRTIPADARRVTMTFTNHFSRVIVDKKYYFLSPGAQIRDTNNRLVLPSHLRGTFKVRYQLNKEGRLHRIWLLTRAEAEAYDPDDLPEEDEEAPPPSEEDEKKNEKVEEVFRTLRISR